MNMDSLYLILVVHDAKGFYYACSYKKKITHFDELCVFQLELQSNGIFYALVMHFLKL